MALSVQAGSAYLTASGCHIESYDWGAPRLKSDAAVWDIDNQPNAYPGDRHEDATFTLTLILQGSTASATEAEIAARLAAIVPNASLTVTEGEGSAIRYTFVRTVTDPKIERHWGTWARVTIQGTRCPYWHGSQVNVSETSITDLYGTVAADDIPGDVNALTRYYLTAPSGSSGIVLGVRPTASSFIAQVNESGTVDASGIGGEVKTTACTSSAYTDISSTWVITAGAYSGRYLIAARMNADASAGDTYVRASVTTGATTVTSDVSICTDADTKTVIVGPLTIPAGGWSRDFPSSNVKLQAKPTSSGDCTLDAWWLIAVPSPLTTDAALVHLDEDACVDGIPLDVPNVYAYTRATDSIGESTLDKSTPWGWPMLRPGDNTLHVHFDHTNASGTGYVSLSYVPRYLLPA